MRDKMERFVLLPFSVGCVSESSIAVAVHQPRRSTPKSLPKNSSKTSNREDDEDSLSSHESMKNSFKFLAIPKPDISNGFNRLFKGFKNFSQLFAYKEEMEEMEREMEIGFPTDVKHVTHIGLDGSTTKNINNNNNINNNPMKGWDSLISPELLTTLPSVSLDQFELPQAQAQAQAQTQPQPLVKSPTAQTMS